MTYEKLKEKLLYLLKIEGRKEKSDEKTEEIVLLLKAVNKQIPQDAITQIAEHTTKIGNGFFRKGTTIHKCPSCGKWISRIYKYCGHCGQLVEFKK